MYVGRREKKIQTPKKIFISVSKGPLLIETSQLSSIGVNSSLSLSLSLGPCTISGSTCHILRGYRTLQYSIPSQWLSELGENVFRGDGGLEEVCGV